jgi:hypothetical protein
MDCNVDMNDPRWPSLREAARRFLREDDCTLSVPSPFLDEAWKLVQSISDHIPSKTVLPVVIEGDFNIIDMAYFGPDEPGVEICWVPHCEWNDFSEQVIDLLEAGYPGCIGCAGPGAEGEWNETFRRGHFIA